MKFSPNRRKFTDNIASGVLLFTYIKNLHRILTLRSHIEKVRESMFKIHVQCSNQCQYTLKFFQYLIHSIQINKAAIKLYPRDFSFQCRYLNLEKQKHNVTKVLIDKKEKKAPQMKFDSPPFSLPYLFLNSDHLPVNSDLETSKKELCPHDTDINLITLNRCSNQVGKETYLA